MPQFGPNLQPNQKKKKFCVCPNSSFKRLESGQTYVCVCYRVVLGGYIWNDHLYISLILHVILISVQFYYFIKFRVKYKITRKFGLMPCLAKFFEIYPFYTQSTYMKHHLTIVFKYSPAPPTSFSVSLRYLYIYHWLSRHFIAPIIVIIKFLWNLCNNICNLEYCNLGLFLLGACVILFIYFICCLALFNLI